MLYNTCTLAIAGVNTLIKVKQDPLLLEFIEEFVQYEKIVQHYKCIFIVKSEVSSGIFFHNSKGIYLSSDSKFRELQLGTGDSMIYCLFQDFVFRT